MADSPVALMTEPTTCLYFGPPRNLEQTSSIRLSNHGQNPIAWKIPPKGKMQVCSAIEERLLAIALSEGYAT